MNLNELLDKLQEEPVKSIDETWCTFEERCTSIYQDRLLACVEALEMAIELVKIWHGIDHGHVEEKQMWELYQQSPGMKRITAKLAAALEQK